MPKSLSISWFLATRVLLGVCDSQVWEGKRGDASLVLSVRVCRALWPASRGGKARRDGAGES